MDLGKENPDAEFILNITVSFQRLGDQGISRSVLETIPRGALKTLASR